MEDGGIDCFVEKKLDPRHKGNLSLLRNKRCLLAIMFIRYCMWLTICPTPGRSVLVLCLRCDYNLFLSSHRVCRCQKPPCRSVSRVGVARQRCPRTLWLCTSSRSPWLMGSPLRRSNSSSSQASRANSSRTTRS